MHEKIIKMFDLKGRMAVVTGGAAHLGRDAAEVLAAAGAGIIVTSRERERARAAAAEIADRYAVPAFGIAMDQTSAASVAAAAQEAAALADGGIDILVNNAGGGGGGTSATATLFERETAHIDMMLQTNLAGVIYCCRSFGSLMAARGKGSIINIASVAAHLGRDRRVYAENGLKGQPVDYAAAKAGILGLTRDLAAYVGPKGVRVNAISPGGFARPDMPAGFVRDYSARTILGRMGKDGQDLDGAVLYLASDASSYVTGQEIVVDGGFTLLR